MCVCVVKWIEKRRKKRRRKEGRESWEEEGKKKKERFKRSREIGEGGVWTWLGFWLGHFDWSIRFVLFCVGLTKTSIFNHVYLFHHLVSSDLFKQWHWIIGYPATFFYSHPISLDHTFRNKQEPTMQNKLSSAHCFRVRQKVGKVPIHNHHLKESILPPQKEIDARGDKSCVTMPSFSLIRSSLGYFLFQWFLGKARLVTTIFFSANQRASSLFVYSYNMMHFFGDATESKRSSFL